MENEKYDPLISLAKIYGFLAASKDTSYVSRNELIALCPEAFDTIPKYQPPVFAEDELPAIH